MKYWIILAVIGWCLVLCLRDLRERRLPNRLTLGGACLVLCLKAGFGGLPMAVDSVTAALAAGAFLLLPFLLHGAGGGDVKMMFAAGAVVGLTRLTHLLWYTSLAGLVYGGILILIGSLDGSRVKHCARTILDWRYDRRSGAQQLPPRDSERVRIPFSIPIAAGLLMAMMWG